MNEVKTRDSIPELLSPGKAAALVDTHLKVITVLDDLAQIYVTDKLSQSKRSGSKIDEDEERVKARTALTDLYFIGNDRVKLNRFHDQWGYEGEPFERLLVQKKDYLSEIMAKSASNAESYNALDRTRIAVKAAWKSGTESQFSGAFRLLETLGYPPDTNRKILTSFGLTTVTTVGASALISAGLGYGATHPFLGEVSNTNSLIAVALSYVLEYVAAYINARQNIAALHDAKIGTSPNIIATFAYLYLKKLVPENEKLQNLGVISASIAPAVIGELISSSPLLLPNGASMVVAKNIASTIAQLSTAAGVKWYRNKISST